MKKIVISPCMPLVLILCMACLAACGSGGGQAGGETPSATTAASVDRDRTAAGDIGKASEAAGNPAALYPEDRHDDNVIRASDLEGFIRAIGPGNAILLEGDGVHISRRPDSYEGTGWTPEDYGNPYAVWEHVYDGYELQITGVEGLSVKGAGAGRFPLTNEATYASVLTFIECTDILIENIEAGHSVIGDTGCEEGVFHFVSCENIAIRDAGMCGCGTEGLWLESVRGMTVEDSEIYDCTKRLLSIGDSFDDRGCEDIAFRNVTFRDTGCYNLILLYQSRDVVFEDCRFVDNYAVDWEYTPEGVHRVFYTEDSRNVVVRSCEFNSNDVFVLSGAPFSGDPVRFENCSFRGNTFDDYGELQHNVWHVERWPSDDFPEDYPLSPYEIFAYWEGGWSGYVTISEAGGDVLPGIFPQDKALEAEAYFGYHNNRPFIEVYAAPEGADSIEILISAYVEPTADGVVFDVSSDDEQEGAAWIGNIYLTSDDRHFLSIQNVEGYIFLEQTVSVDDQAGRYLTLILFLEKDYDGIG